MTVRICLLKHIFNLIENGDWKGAYDTICYIICIVEKCRWSKQNYLRDLWWAYCIWKYVIILIPKDFKVEILMLMINLAERPQEMKNKDLSCSNLMKRLLQSVIIANCTGWIKKFEKKAVVTEKGNWKVILLHDYPRPHVASATKDTLVEFKWEVLSHPAYSSDFAPSDF